MIDYRFLFSLFNKYHLITQFFTNINILLRENDFPSETNERSSRLHLHFAFESIVEWFRVLALLVLFVLFVLSNWHLLC